MPKKLDIFAEVKPYTESHAIASIQKNGRQYGCTWAIHKDEEGNFVYPTTEEVLEAYKEDPRSFDPYNVRRGY
ncbi:hypothetical protein CN918_31290 [Priestia megaterium]|nr:hypothetical protein CN918_31290 [Priestia megaterium]